MIFIQNLFKLAHRGHLVLLCALWPWAAMAQPTPDWTLVDSTASAARVAVDRNSNAFVVGTTTATAMQITKAGPAGTLLWQRRFGAAGTLSRGVWVSADGSGNAVAAGLQIGSTGLSLGPVVQKFDAAGNLLWQDLIASPNANVLRVESDAAGNAYLLWRRVTITPGLPAALDMQLTKYSAAGLPLWTQSYGATAAGQDSIAILANGSVVVAGMGAASDQTRLAVFDAAGNLAWSTTLLATAGVSAVAAHPLGGFHVVGGGIFGGFLVARFDASFAQLWRTEIPARGVAARAAVDAAGNVVVSGAVDTNTGMLTVVLYAWSTLKLDPNGLVMWSRTFGDGSFGGSQPSDLALGADGSVYLAGPGITRDALGVPTMASTTVKYGADGTQLWAANATAASPGIGVKLGGDGGVVVLGQTPQALFRYAQTGTPNQPPVAIASANPSAGPAPLTVAFSSAASTDADGRIASTTWDFGDGQTSTAANPSHTYAPGQYSARLTVTDTVGATSVSAPIVITSNAAPPPAQPTSISLPSLTIVGGGSMTATVRVSSAAGVSLKLWSSNTSVVKLPATLVVPAGATAASFTVKTSRVNRDTVVTLRASANGAAVQTDLTVRRGR